MEQHLAFCLSCLEQSRLVMITKMTDIFFGEAGEDEKDEIRIETQRLER